MRFADAADLGADDGRVRGDFESRHLRDLLRRLSDARRVDRPAWHHEQLAESLRLRLVREIRLLRLEAADDSLAHTVLGDDRLLARADRAVVERLARYDLRDCVVEVRRGVDENRHVARSDAECRLAARIRSLDDARATGGEDDAGAFMPH